MWIDAHSVAGFHTGSNFHVLASFLLSLSIRIDGPTRASLYLCFDFHFDDSLRTSIWIDENTLTRFNSAFDFHFTFPFHPPLGSMPGPPPFGSIAPPPPALTLVLTCMLILQLTVVVYASTYAALNARFCFHSVSLSRALTLFRCGTVMSKRV